MCNADRRAEVVELLQALIQAWQSDNADAVAAASQNLRSLGVNAELPARGQVEIEGVGRLYDARTTAKLLSISPRTLWALTKAGEIAHVKVGRRVLYSPADLADWIDRSRVGETGQTAAGGKK